MAFLVLSIVIFLGLFIGLNIQSKGGRFFFRFRGRSLVAFLALLIMTPAFFAKVSANEVGIVYDLLNGGLQDEALGEGLHVVSPFKQVNTISTKLRENSFSVTAQTGRIIRENDEGTTEETGGGQFATYQVTIQYSVEVVNAHQFYRSFGGNVVSQSIIEARIREALQSNSVEYDIFSILKGDLNEVRVNTELDLIESLGEIGLIVNAFIINDIDAGDNIEQVVEAEATAAKQKEIALKDQEAELIRKETTKLSAEIQAETVVIEANAQAEAERILYSVTANAIYTMYEGQFLDETGNVDETIKNNFEVNSIGGYLTITEIGEIVVKQLYYDTWDGVLPQIVSGDATDIIVSP